MLPRLLCSRGANRAPRPTHRLAELTLSLAAAGSLAAVGPAVAATTPTTTPSTVKASAAPGAPGARGGGTDRAFCTQVTTSQTSIGKATGGAIAKLKATADEWVKIEGAAPTTIKASVTLIRTAYQTAAKAGTSDAVKVAAVTAAGTKVTAFVSANCRGGGPGGVDMTAYRDCLTKQGVNFGTPGSGPRPNATDPKVQAAMKACADKLPAGAQGGFGGFGGGGAAGAAAGGTTPTLDAKTLKAMQECQAAAQSATATTIKK